MSAIVYLSTLDVEALHAFIMERTGDEPAPVRERGLLESAVMRPQMAAHYANVDMVEQCALLVLGISGAQAFLDGNKRTAFIAGDVFMRINGNVFCGDSLEMARQIEAVSTRNQSEEEATAAFVGWLRGQMRVAEDHVGG